MTVKELAKLSLADCEILVRLNALLRRTWPAGRLDQVAVLDDDELLAMPDWKAGDLSELRALITSGENLTLGTRRQQLLGVEICRSFSDRNGLSSAKSGLPAR
jgi:hypothetical protein